MYRVFKDGEKEPIIECQAYGSKDVDGKLYLVADGAEIEVTGKLIVTAGERDANGDYQVADVLEPNEVALQRRLEADAAREATEKADAERMVAEKRSVL